MAAETMAILDRDRWRGRPVEGRLRYLLTEMLVEHPFRRRFLKAIAERLDHRNRGGEAVGLLALAPPGGGKTRILQDLESIYPRRRLNDRDERPYVHLTVPTPCTLKEFANAILEGLDDPFSEGGKAKFQVARAKNQLREARTVLLGIDNAQDIVERTGPIGIRVVGNFIRELIDRPDRIVVLLLGTEEATFVLDANRQLKRRIPGRLLLSDYPIETKLGLSQFMRLTKEFDQLIPLAEYSHLGEGDLGRALAFASDGRMAHLVNLLSRAIVRALGDSRENVAVEDLSSAYEEYFLIGAHLVNPFVPGFKDWRRLDRPGEPHYMVVDPRQRRKVGP